MKRSEYYKGNTTQHITLLSDLKRKPLPSKFVFFDNLFSSFSDTDKKDKDTFILYKELGCFHGTELKMKHNKKLWNDYFDKLIEKELDFIRTTITD